LAGRQLQDEKLGAFVALLSDISYSLPSTIPVVQNCQKKIPVVQLAERFSADLPPIAVHDHRCMCQQPIHHLRR